MHTDAAWMLIVMLAFVAGITLGRWDVKHGADVGERAGRWTRTHVFGLPPLPQQPTQKGGDDHEKT